MDAFPQELRDVVAIAMFQEENPINSWFDLDYDEKEIWYKRADIAAVKIVSHILTNIKYEGTL